MKRSLIDEYIEPISSKFNVNEQGELINVFGESVGFSSLGEIPRSNSSRFNNLTMKYNYERVLDYEKYSKTLRSKKIFDRQDYQTLTNYRNSVEWLLNKILSYPNNHYIKKKKKIISKTVAVNKCRAVLNYIDEILEIIERQLGIITSGKKVD